MGINMGYDTGFRYFSVFFAIAFIAVIGIIVATIVRGIRIQNRNNHSPRLSVIAKVVAKRMDVSHHNRANGGDINGTQGYHSTSYTDYYVTFQVESGDRMELFVPSNEYGMLVEGDEGKLSFQGTRYLGFERLY